MKNIKQTKKISIKNRFIKYKKNIFIIIGLLFILTAIFGFYDNFYMWVWSDFFLSLFLLIIGFIFLPFTYKLQKKYFGNSIFSSTLFIIFMYLFFVFSSFSVLLSIFKGNFTINIFSIFYFLIILLWRSTFLPITVVKRKKYFGKNILLRRKRIFIFFIIFSSLLLIFDITSYLNGSSDFSNNEKNLKSVSTKNNNNCYSFHKKLHNDDKINIFISLQNNKGKLNKNTFNMKNIKELKYFIGGKSTNNLYYFNREVCNIDKNKAILPIMYDGGILVDKIYPGAEGGSVGNTSPFSDINFEKGNYAINVFVSNNNSNRNFAKTLLFKIE